MSEQENIGDWSARTQIEKKDISIIVRGDAPTDGKKPGYNLFKKDPQGFNQTELLLEVMFGQYILKGGPGGTSLYYKETIENEDIYKTVLVVDPNGRTIANIDVKPA